MEALVGEGAIARSFPEFIAQLDIPRVVWLMIPAAAVESIIAEIVPESANLMNAGEKHGWLQPTFTER